MMGTEMLIETSVLYRHQTRLIALEDLSNLVAAKAPDHTFIYLFIYVQQILRSGVA
jgi:hypothetical protein